MKNAVTLVNPWSKAIVEKPISEIVEKLQSIPWPEETLGMIDADTDEEWVEKAVQILGPEQAGVVIIGC